MEPTTAMKYGLAEVEFIAYFDRLDFEELDPRVLRLAERLQKTGFMEGEIGQVRAWAFPKGGAIDERITRVLCIKEAWREEFFHTDRPADERGWIVVYSSATVRRVELRYPLAAVRLMMAVLQAGVEGMT